MRLGVLVAAIALCACGAPEERDDVSYDDRYDATKLDLYLPDGSGKRPAVMLIHPGGWRSPSGRYLMTPAARRLAKSGYVAASIGYRLDSDGHFPAAVQDAWCALSFLRAHADEYRIDVDRIAVLGYSAGGHSAAMLGVSPPDKQLEPDCASGKTGPPRAVIAGAPVLDMRAYDDGFLITGYMDGTAADKPAAYDLASPIRYVRPGLPPFLFVVGAGDWWVGPDDSRAMRDDLVAKGNYARLLELNAGGHVLNPLGEGTWSWSQTTESPEAWLAIEDFLGRTIGKP